ncbi:SDR family NAD(P)-dependent oxidoreductase [Glacieibacterium megasporae]|uniref:SDR family NAD(P)-dependent oxidoreductase n=1 Tax=Glacieibacterium megasporae TaxID=2835787 RepID=UPI001C1E68D1|nr:SDR family NAD(P)-dependent oxidoreductase [Polymorphobacter megasporae]UAJ12171.1 SDR family NAD(P)-dependent oxidoreductase [Polymorphobacter megasporae]
MDLLSSFAADPRIVVIGASGGIGTAFADLLRDRGEVIALSRADLDLTDPPSITAAAARIGGPIDLVIVATGLLHDAVGGPEKALRDLDTARLARSFAVNAIGPTLVAAAFLPLLRNDRKTAFAALSARVGSIADNRLGGWYGYRASKAALNQLLRTAAIEHARRAPLSVVAALHPGTVDTRLSAPFQRGVAPGKLFAPAFSARAMLDVLDRLTPADSGGLFAWDGAPIPF